MNLPTFMVGGRDFKIKVEDFFLHQNTATPRVIHIFTGKTHLDCSTVKRKDNVFQIKDYWM